MSLSSSVYEHGKIPLRTYSKDPWGQENVQGFVSAWKLTEEDQARLWNLQRRLADVDHFRNEPESVLRFMVAPTGYDQAEHCFRKMIEWRRENNVDTIFDDYHPPQELLDKAGACMLDGMDRDGDPIYVERGGALDVGDLMKRYSREELIKYSIWNRELHTRGAWIDEYQKKAGKRIKGVTVVYDLEGLCSKHVNPKVLDTFHDIMKITNENYPGPIKRIIIIRAPSIFRYVWSVVKHFFRASARAKMVFPGKDYLEVLDRYIDRDVLPSCIAKGGKGRMARGLPNLVGHTPPAPEEASKERPASTKVAWKDDHSTFSRACSSLSDISLAATIDDDDTSLSSRESQSTATVSVCSTAIATGCWEESANGQAKKISFSFVLP